MRTSRLQTATGCAAPSRAARTQAAPMASLPLLRRLAGAGRAALAPARRPAGAAAGRAGSLRCLAAKEGGRKGKEDSPYSATVALPQTAFEMRANAATREPQVQAWWAEHGIYEKLSRGAAGAPFTLHDGPPYANGDLHIGHALNKILKDFVNRFELLRGRRARLVPGWDCHGLPIELKVLQSMKDAERRALTPPALRAAAAAFARKTVDAQREQFQRYGVWADWEAPYLTLEPAYEAAQLRVFAAMFLNGHVYRGRKPVHWSPSSRTALAEAELEYPEGHVSRAAYVALPLEAAAAGAAPAAAAALTGAHLAVWTTTPWTIPANLAVAVNGSLEYAVVEVGGGAPADWTPRRLIVAAALVDALAEKLGASLTTVATLTGEELAGATYRHPLAGRASPVVVGGDYVTTEAGTGLVHTAPGHGQEDYAVGQRFGLPLLSPVDDAGRFTAEAGAAFEGLPVQGEGNAAVLAALRAAGVLLLEEDYAHKYPYDWRTKKPTIFRATDQWFASVEGFRGAALEAIEGVTWTPASGRNRITAMTEGRADWCISRQRAWGVPLPVFYRLDDGVPLVTAETLEHVAAIVEAQGAGAWWELPLEELLPPALRHLAPELKRGDDTMDVWFDSGSSWAGVLAAKDGAAHAGLNYPADLYLEGSDQHRGWFQSSLLTSVAARGGAPYKAVLTHGFVLDERGAKMSKSVGNVVDPRQVILGGKDLKAEPAYGADVLRLWVASVDYTADVMIGGRIIAQAADAYRKLRFTLRFLLGNLAGFDPAVHALPLAELSATDRFVLARAAALVDECTAAFEAYAFCRAYQALTRFVVVDLSNFYLDVAKDRLYVLAGDARERRAAQTTLNLLLRALLPLVAPLAPHMAEDAWLNLPYAAPTLSVFEAGWAAADPAWRAQPAEEALGVRAVLAVRAAANQLLEKARSSKALGAGLEAAVRVHVSDASVRAALEALQASANGQDALRYALIVSEAELVGSAAEAAAAPYAATAPLDLEDGAGPRGELTVGVQRAGGCKCARCWSYSGAVGADAEHPALCERCSPVVRGLGFASPTARPAPEAVAST